MRLTTAVIIAGAALGLTPVAAQNTMANNTVIAPAPDANAVAPDANVTATVPVDMNVAVAEPAPVDTAATEPAPARRGSDMLPWGLLGLLGLIGLFGRKRST